MGNSQPGINDSFASNDQSNMAKITELVFNMLRRTNDLSNRYDTVTKPNWTSPTRLPEVRHPFNPIPASDTLSKYASQLIRDLPQDTIDRVAYALTTSSGRSTIAEWLFFVRQITVDRPECLDELNKEVLSMIENDLADVATISTIEKGKVTTTVDFYLKQLSPKALGHCQRHLETKDGIREFLDWYRLATKWPYLWRIPGLENLLNAVYFDSLRLDNEESNSTYPCVEDSPLQNLISSLQPQITTALNELIHDPYNYQEIMYGLGNEFGLLDSKDFGDAYRAIEVLMNIMVSQPNT